MRFLAMPRFWCCVLLLCGLSAQAQNAASGFAAHGRNDVAAAASR